MSRRRNSTRASRPLARAAAGRGGSGLAVARGFDRGEPIRLESISADVPAFIDSPDMAPAAAPADILVPAMPAPTAPRSASLAAPSMWSDAVEQLGNSPYPFAVDDYSAAADGEVSAESATRPDNPDEAVAASLSADLGSPVDDPDAAPPPAAQEAPAIAPATAAAVPAARRETAPERSAATGDWDVATDEAFEKTLEEAQQRAAAPPPQQPAPALPSPQSAPVAAMASGHDIFDRMASAMQHATAFDLGRHEVDDRLDDFEAEVLNPPKPPAPSPGAEAAMAAALSLDDTDLVAQLAMMEVDEPSVPAAAPLPVPAAPADSPGPSSLPATNPPSEAQP